MNNFNRISECRYGKMIYNIHDRFVGKSLATYGEYSEGEVDVFKQILKKGESVIEVGSNIGSHTVPLAEIVGRYGKVYAFEPQRLAFQILNGNLAINSIDNVHTYQLAVSDKPGTITVPVLDPRANNNWGGLELGSYVSGEKVAVVTLDNLDIPKCKLIKVDVEGMELNVIKGAEKYIKQHQPVLYVESDREDRHNELAEYIASLGYNLYWHEPALFNIDNFNEKKENLFTNPKGATYISRNLLCVHKESTIKITNFRAVELGTKNKK